MTLTDGDPATGAEPGDPPPGSASTATSEPDAGGRAHSSAKSLIEWVLVIVGALLVALFIRTFVFTTFWIPSESMEPTLIGDPSGSGRHDRVVVNRLSYRFHDVRRGDIVVFETPPGLNPRTAEGRDIKDLIKRVVGLPGETVTLNGGHVYVDGKLLPEPYLPDGLRTYKIPANVCSGTQDRIVVPKGSVLVLGDNRAHSEDGRCFGPIKQSTIVGRAFIRVWPVNKVTWL